MSKNTIKCIYCNGVFDLRKIKQTDKGYLNQCIECHKIKVRERIIKGRNTFNGFMQRLLDCAKGSAKRRLSKGRIATGKINLTKEQLIEIYNKQNGFLKNM